MLASQQRVGLGGQPPVRFVGILPEVPFVGGSPAWPIAPYFTERDARWATRGAAGGVWLDDGSGCMTERETIGARALRGGLWRVSSYGATVIRDYGDGLTLPDMVINGQQPLPTNVLPASRVGFPSIVVVNVKIADTQARQYQFDAGQTVFVYGDDVSVSWSAPGPGVPLPSTNGQGFVDMGGNANGGVALPFDDPESLIVEGLLYVELARVEAPRQQGQNYAKLTQTWQAATGQRVIVPVPAGARRVQINRDPSGAVVAGTWEVGFSDGTAFAAIGSLSSGSAAFQRTGLDTFMGNPTHLRSPVIGEDHTWLITWEIAP